jgi:hypothetical protein
VSIFRARTAKKALLNKVNLFAESAPSKSNILKTCCRAHATGYHQTEFGLEYTMAWPEVTWFYPAEVKAVYYAGTLLREWFNKYPPLSAANPNGHYLFRDKMLMGRDMPHSGPMKGACFFREFYMGMQYLDAGYEAMVYQREVEDGVCFRKACELFGDTGGCAVAGKFIVPNDETGGRAPDLIVFKPGTKLFRFVECKGKGENLTQAQPARFTGIEEYLNASLAPGTEALFDPAHPKLFLHFQQDVGST